MIDGFVGIEKISLVDFEGYVTCTLFTSGCNFRCPWCHNGPLVNNDVEKPLDFNEIIDYLTSRKKIIEAVCITGGEPTLMASLPYYIKKIKDLGFVIKLDTNGTNPKMVKELIDNHLVDYIAMDIKSGTSNYSMVAGINKVPLEKIKETINILETSNIHHEFRTTLVKEFHDFDSIKEIKDLINGTKTYYLQHFVERDSSLSKGFHEVKKETAIEYKEYLEQFITNVYLRGY